MRYRSTMIGQLCSSADDGFAGDGGAAHSRARVAAR